MPDRSDRPDESYKRMARQSYPYDSLHVDFWVLGLSRYQRDNLLQLLEQVMSGDERPVKAFNNGDWVGEIRWMLGKHSAHKPVTEPDPNNPHRYRAIPAITSIDEDDSPNQVYG